MFIQFFCLLNVYFFTNPSSEVPSQMFINRNRPVYKQFCFWLFSMFVEQFLVNTCHLFFSFNIPNTNTREVKIAWLLALGGCAVTVIPPAASERYLLSALAVRAMRSSRQRKFGRAA